MSTRAVRIALQERIALSKEARWLVVHAIEEEWVVSLRRRLQTAPKVAACRHAKQAAAPWSILDASVLLLDPILERASSAIERTVAEERALPAVHDVMALMAQANADCADTGVTRQPARVAVVPVLLFVLLAGPQEGALFLRPLHVLCVVGHAIVEDVLLVAFE